jgi:hypothetical protein
MQYNKLTIKCCKLFVDECCLLEQISHVSKWVVNCSQYYSKTNTDKENKPIQVKTTEMKCEERKRTLVIIWTKQLGLQNNGIYHTSVCRWN